MGFDSQFAETLTNWRVERGLNEINYAQLKAESGSLDPEIAKTAQRKLFQYFENSPERSSEQAKTVDMMEQLEGFSEEIIDKLLKNLVGFQFTEGCNGQCAFCAFGKKKGVESKFSFESIKTFFEKYHTKLRTSSGFVSHYWDSDPFDYQDGDHKYLDVYKEWHKYFPEKSVHVSTSIPKGSVESFLEFNEYLIENYYKNLDKDTKEQRALVRISVGPQNLQRVEAVMKEFKSRMVAKGYQEYEVQSFISNNITFSPRFKEDVKDLGDNISKHDEFKELATPACSDGVLITPGGVEAISMTAPTIYNPTGEYSYTIGKNSGKDSIPQYLPKYHFQGFQYEGHLADRVRISYIMIPQVNKAGTSEVINLPNPDEDLTFKMGRYSLSLYYLIQDISDLDKYSEAVNTPFQTREEYLSLCSRFIRSEKDNIHRLAENASKRAESATDESLKNKLIYYEKLMRVNLAKAEYIANLIYMKSGLSLIVSAAEAMNEINRKNVDNLPQVLENLQICYDQSESFTIVQKRVALNKVFNLLGISSDESPRWARLFK